MSEQNCKHYDSADFNNGEKSGTVCLKCGRIQTHAIKLPAPYPDHIYQAAHKALENGGTGYDILKAAWEAATVNTHDELARLPEDSVVITGEPLNEKTITRVYEKPTTTSGTTETT
jgi:hypothetical protein